MNKYSGSEIIESSDDEGEEYVIKINQNWNIFFNDEFSYNNYCFFLNIFYVIIAIEIQRKYGIFEERRIKRFSKESWFWN